jgi:uncharacterized protein (DUF1778 family)
MPLSVQLLPAKLWKWHSSQGCSPLTPCPDSSRHCNILDFAMKLKTPDQILESKDRRIEVRITQRELDQIDRAAQNLGLTRSEYLRLRGLKKVYTRRQSLPDLDYAKLMVVYRELQAQGNNLNQIARSLHQAKLEGKEIDGLDEIDRVIATNRQALQTIVTHLQSINGHQQN